MEKGTGFAKILDDVFNEYKTKNVITGKDPTDIFSDIAVIAQERYFEKHPFSKKTDDELIRGAIGDRLSEKIRNIAFGNEE